MPRPRLIHHGFLDQRLEACARDLGQRFRKQAIEFGFRLVGRDGDGVREPKVSSGAGETGMQGLKVLVVVMGILIVISIPSAGASITGSRSEASPAAKGVLSRRCAHPKSLGEVRVDLPAGCAVVEMRPHADRLYLRTGPTGLCERIIVLDATSGQVLGTFVLRP